MSSPEDDDLDVEAAFETELAKLVEGGVDDADDVLNGFNDLLQDADADGDAESDGEPESLQQLRAAYQRRDHALEEFGRELEEVHREIRAADAAAKPTPAQGSETGTQLTGASEQVPSSALAAGDAGCVNGAVQLDATSDESPRGIVPASGADTGDASRGDSAATGSTQNDARGDRPAAAAAVAGDMDAGEAAKPGPASGSDPRGSAPANEAVPDAYGETQNDRERPADQDARDTPVPADQPTTAGGGDAPSGAPGLELRLEEAPEEAAAPDEAALEALRALEARQAAAAAEREALLASAAAEREREAAEREAMQRRLEAVQRAAAERAAAREAAMEAIRREVEELARRHMAAWRIGRAWRAYRRGPVWASRRAAVVHIQAAWRGYKGRQRAALLRRERDAIRALEEAAKTGRPDVLQSAVARAQELGLHDVVRQRLSELQQATDDVAARLKLAAASGPFAEFRAALAAAQPYPQLAERVAECTAVFEKRRAEAEATLRSAVEEQPMAQFMRVLDSMSALGVEPHALKAALEAVRQRDADLVAQLAAAASAAGAGAGVGTEAGAVLAVATALPRGGSQFDAVAFEALAERATKLGLKGDVAASKHVVEKSRRALAAELHRAAGPSSAATAAELRSLAAEARRLGMRSEAEDLERQVLHRQQELQTALQLAAEKGSSARLVLLIQAAHRAAVPAVAIQAARQSLLSCQVAREAALATAAASGTLHTALVARGSAARSGLPLGRLVPTDRALTARRRATVAGLQEALLALPGSSLPATARTVSRPPHLPQQRQQQQQAGLPSWCSALGPALGLGVPLAVLERAAGRQVPVLPLEGAEGPRPFGLEVTGPAPHSSGSVARGGKGGPNPGVAGAPKPAHQGAGPCAVGFGRRGRHAAPPSDSLMGNRPPASLTAGGASHGDGLLGELLAAVRTLWSQGVSALQLGLPDATCLALCALQLRLRVDMTRGSTTLRGEVVRRNYWGDPLLDQAQPDASSPDRSGAASLRTSRFEANGRERNSDDGGEEDALAGRVLGAAARSSGGGALPLVGPWPWPWAVMASSPALTARRLDGLAPAGGPGPPRHPTPPPPGSAALRTDSPHVPPGSADRAARPLTRAVLLRNAPATATTTATANSAPAAPAAGSASSPAPSLDRITRLALDLERLSSLAGLDCMCQALRTLHANSNELTSLEGLQGLGRLRELSLKNNRLASCLGPGATPGERGHGRGPGQAGTGHGSGSWLPMGGALRRLALDSNKLSGTLSGLAGCSGLRSLSLADNSVTDLGTDLAACAGSLSRLDVRANCLAGPLPRCVPPPALAALTGLRHLDVSGNRLSDLEGLQGLHVLESLNAAGNALTDLPLPLWLPHLTSLDLSRNALSSYGAAAAAAAGSSAASGADPKHQGLGPVLPSLEQLFLQENQISRLGPLAPYPRLTALDLSFNRLPSLEALRPLAALTGLMRLMISDNPATEAWTQQAGGPGGAAGGGGPLLAQRIGGRAGGDVLQAPYRATVLALVPSLRELDLDRVGEGERGGAHAVVAAAAGGAGSSGGGISASSGCSPGVLPPPQLLRVLRGGAVCGLVQLRPAVRGTAGGRRAGGDGAGVGTSPAATGGGSAQEAGIARGIACVRGGSGTGTLSGRTRNRVGRQPVGVSLGAAACGSDPLALRRLLLLSQPAMAGSSSAQAGGAAAAAAGAAAGAAGAGSVGASPQSAAQQLWAAAAPFDLAELHRRQAQHLQRLDPWARRGEAGSSGVSATATSSSALATGGGLPWPLPAQPAPAQAAAGAFGLSEPALLDAPALRRLRPLCRAQTWLAANSAGPGAAGPASGKQKKGRASAEAAEPAAVEALAAEVEARWDREEGRVWREHVEEMRAAVESLRTGSSSIGAAAGSRGGDKDHPAGSGAAAAAAVAAGARAAAGGAPAKGSLIQQWVVQPSYYVLRMMRDGGAAATVIQACWRGLMARRQLAAMKSQDHQALREGAAVAIQSWWRGHRVRTGAEVRQARARAAAERQERQRLEAERRNAAATKIQAYFRGHRVRKRLRAAMAAARMPAASAGGADPDSDLDPDLPGASGELEDLLAFLQPLDKLFQDEQPQPLPVPQHNRHQQQRPQLQPQLSSGTTSAQQGALGLSAPPLGGGLAATVLQVHAASAAPPAVLHPGSGRSPQQALPHSHVALQGHAPSSVPAVGHLPPLQLASPSSLSTPSGPLPPAQPLPQPPQGQVNLQHSVSSDGVWPDSGPGQQGPPAAPAAAWAGGTPPGRTPLSELRIPGADGVPGEVGEQGGAGGADVWVNTPGGASAASPSGSVDHAAREQRHLLRLQKLMAEWGFKDLATAEAYYRRTLRQKQGQIRRKLQDKYRDPVQRLHKLQQAVEARHGPLPPHAGRGGGPRRQSDSSPLPRPQQQPPLVGSPGTNYTAVGSAPGAGSAGGGGSRAGGVGVLPLRNLNSADNTPTGGAAPSSGSSDPGSSGRLLPPLIKRSNSHGNAPLSILHAATGPGLQAGVVTTGRALNGGAAAGAREAPGGRAPGVLGGNAASPGRPQTPSSRSSGPGALTPTNLRGQHSVPHTGLVSGGGSGGPTPQSPLLPPLANNWINSPARTPPRSGISEASSHAASVGSGGSGGRWSVGGGGLQVTAVPAALVRAGGRGAGGRGSGVGAAPPQRPGALLGPGLRGYPPRPEF